MRTIRTLALVALLVVGLNALESRRPLTNTQIKKIENLKSGQTWGSLIVALAELHTMSQGPLDELVVAIQSVVADIETKLVRADEEFAQRTQQHNTEVRTLTDLINEAQRNIADTRALIENVLIPQRNQLTEEIANLYRRIEETKTYIQTTTNDRVAAHTAFLERIQEHSSAVAAIHEALSVLDQLNGETSLVQIKRFQKSIEKIAKHVQGKHFIEGTFVKSLLALTNTEFANSEAVENVRSLLVKVLGNLETSLTTENDEEQKAQKEFEADIKRQQGNIVDYTESIAQKNEDLSRTEEQIANSNEFIDQRTADLASYNQDLEEENAAYERATAAYNDLVAQLQAEHSACVEALQVVSSATIEDYIGGRMSQTSDKVIGTNHGSGVEVAGGRFQFE